MPESHHSAPLPNSSQENSIFRKRTARGGQGLSFEWSGYLLSDIANNSCYGAAFASFRIATVDDLLPLRTADVDRCTGWIRVLHDRLHDCSGEIIDIWKNANLLPSCFNQTGTLPLQQLWSDCSFDEVAANSHKPDSQVGQFRNHVAKSFLPCFFACSNWLITVVHRFHSIEMRQMARDKHHSPALTEQWNCSMNKADLRVEIQSHRITSVLVFFESTAGI